ncbi:dipicolinate synthase [Sporosarcina limicola]|uniref:Dipicolinate synthase subunit A n=1 Tax=Sporosarcina limicola TaxID=34101 RepID=A0A927R218_9BACL|nr:dipicolinate synthase [Sporosarcina limicola]MBE1553411.1 dipicolinate synthase subunit A [Sporosarcina limicola]
MKEDKWLFIGTDNRLAICSEILTERGCSSHHIGTNYESEQLEKDIEEFAPHQIVFPILQMKGTPSPALLDKETRLFTGVASEEWLKPFKDVGLSIQSYLQEEQFIWQNARLTAEAFVHEYYARTKRSIAGSQFLVAGFGRVGKITADVLASLGGDVTILARSDVQIGEASVLGYKIERLTADFDLTEGNLINTIPAKWLSVTEQAGLHVFDLASAPGCLRAPLSSEYYTVLLGLPGKHFPVDAATALADALGRMSSR